MSNTKLFPQVDVEQGNTEDTVNRYQVYAQCIHMLETEARNKAASQAQNGKGGNA